jgi:hypothetical protein
MATRKDIDNERLTPVNLERVISLLEPTDGTKAITKKEACAILGIAYNTTRLGTIIEKYKADKVRDAARRAEKRGKPATMDEIQFVIQEYLEGGTVDAISKATYRGTTFVKAILEKYSVPIRATSQNYFSPELIPEGATRDRFTVGEIVYSARYDSTARIEAEQNSAKHGWIYRIWLIGDKWKEFAYQEACELASLQHLREIGVRV